MPVNKTVPKILLVDDYEMNVEILQDFLEDDYQLAAASSGEEALEKVATFCPDLIILDVMMPGLDGFEVCKQLKRNESTRAIPVIFLSAKTAPADIVTGFDSGGADYIVKPFHYEEVRSRVRTQLELVASRRALECRNEEIDRLLEERTYELVLKEREAVLSQSIMGIIHNLKGPLTAIIGADSIIQQAIADIQREHRRVSISQLKDIFELVGLFHESILNLNSMVDKLAKKGRQHLITVVADADLNDILKTELDMLGHDLLFKHRVELTQQLASEPLVMRCLPAEIGHIFACVFNCLRICMPDSERYTLDIGSKQNPEQNYSVTFTAHIIGKKEQKKSENPMLKGMEDEGFKWNMEMALRLVKRYKGSIDYAIIEADQGACITLVFKQS